MTPTTELEVQGTRGSASITAIIDTGFEGDLCLPVSVAVGHGLELVSQVPIELADGTQKLELVFAGSVVFLDRQREVFIYLTDSDDALVGTHLLSNCRLSIDFTTGKTQLTTKRPRGR